MQGYWTQIVYVTIYSGKHNFFVLAAFCAYKQLYEIRPMDTEEVVV